MILKDIVVKKTYQKDGQEKALWNNVGTLKIMDDGKTYMELSMFPTTAFYVFDRKPRQTDPGRDDQGFAKSQQHSEESNDVPF